MEKKKVDITHGQSTARTKGAGAKEKWQKPRLEDVSGKVMAQPYIRFT
jgi:hypothetical protein